MHVPQRRVGHDVVRLAIRVVVDHHRHQVEPVLVHQAPSHRLAVRRPHRHRDPRRAAARQQPVQRRGQPAGRGDGLEGAAASRPEAQRAAVGDDEGAAHAGRPTAVTLPAAVTSPGRALERGTQHVDRLRPQLVQGPVAVDALAQVDLRQAVGAEGLGDVDQQAELDAVATGEAELLEDPAVRRGLPGQRLAHPGQVGEEQFEHGSCHELGDPAASCRVTVQRSGVEALDEGDVVGGQQRAEQPGDEGRRRVGHIGVEEHDDVAGRGRQCGGHGLPLPARATRARDHAGTGIVGLLGGVVERPVVEHDDLVDEPVPAVARPGRAGRPPARQSRPWIPRRGRGCTPRPCAPCGPWPRAPRPSGNPRGG